MLVAMGVALVWGFISGFFKQLGSLAGLVLGVIACRLFGGTVATALASGEGEPSAATVVMAYAITFIVVFFAAKLVAYACRSVLHTLHVGIADRLGGAVLRAFLWLFAISLALNVWGVLSPGSGPQGRTAACVEAFAPWVAGQAQAQIDARK